MSAVADEKEIRWVGSSYVDLLAFPTMSRKEAGFQLGLVQAGIDPSDWKSFDEIGAGVREIRIADSQGIFRVIYVAKFSEAIYVLHCFRKRSQSTLGKDKTIAVARYRAVIAARRNKR
jgi:phage-related protein